MKFKITYVAFKANEQAQIVGSIMSGSINRQIELTSTSLLLYVIKSNQQRRKCVKTFIHKIIQSLLKSNPPYQFIILSQFLEEIVEVSERSQMFNTFNQWLLFLFDPAIFKINFRKIAQNIDGAANIALVTNMTSYGYNVCMKHF